MQESRLDGRKCNRDVHAKYKSSWVDNEIYCLNNQGRKYYGGLEHTGMSTPRIDMQNVFVGGLKLSNSLGTS